MKILLDTHAFIWYVEGSLELSKTARKEIEDNTNQCYLSMASLWEMSIKIGLGKLSLKSPFNTVFDDVSNNGFDLLPIIFEHTLLNAQLTWHHKDPFDRLMIAQVLVKTCVL